MGDGIFNNVFKYKVIYAFTIDDSLHQGLIKVGDSTLDTDTPIDRLTPNTKELNKSAMDRIKEYTTTIGVTPKLLWTELAIRTVKKEEECVVQAFRDYDVHRVLTNSNTEKRKIGNSNEWFDVDIETVKEAIKAVKNSQTNIGTFSSSKPIPIVFRPEQTECIEKVVKHFKQSNKFLINAKMRYGKTFVSLEIIKRCKFEKTIIVTHRPVVDNGWYEDFKKIFVDTDYLYGSKSKGDNVKDLLQNKKPFIYFASVQDLRGSSAVGGKFDKNSDIFDTVWDCIVVDEAHEGTTTALGEETINALYKDGKNTKFLALSGTPFNILENYDDDSIYTWDYIMEQENKSEWDKLHFGDSNPYEELPRLNICTYSLGDILHNSNYISIEDKAFNFKEFFRTFTGDIEKDYEDIPEDKEIGDFVHEKDVQSFLNLMTKENNESNYPFSKPEYRNLFKHSLWIVPGVKEAKALKQLMLKHPVFGCGQFDIVNVAGKGDEEEAVENALPKVKKAIKNAGDNYTITLSCGKLTTGVTVREWTAVFMLAGSYSTSAANYLQTIFRVQSPCNKDGKIKEEAYVFDFAPDRTLKMIASSVRISTKAGKSRLSDKQIMGKFLNFCPVIGIKGSEMKEYSAPRLLQQLKKAYADKAVEHGFDDNNIYNDELSRLTDIDIKEFNNLKAIIGSTKAQQKTKEFDVNSQGLTKEEYEKLSGGNGGNKKDNLTAEEKARLEELKKINKQRKTAISILRGISIRMPLLIYGADVDYEEEISLDKFVELVDDTSWEEFMPDKVTKTEFKKFQKYYDEEVFIASARKIRNIAKAADTLPPTERITKISTLFSQFKNPDKETVLTPWKVVNLHMSNTIGGWTFFDEKFENQLDKPRYVSKNHATEDIFNKDNTKILEINSKTGLYPMYVAYSCFRHKFDNKDLKDIPIIEQNKAWNEVLKNNIFIVCKTPMAKTITKRTLTGYHDIKINAHSFDDLTNMVLNKPEQFRKKVSSGIFWGKEEKEMKFNAIVGNPPYQINISNNESNSSLSKQIFPSFIQQSIQLNPDYVSLITPSRWFTGDAQDKSFIKLREFIQKNQHFEEIHHYPNNKEVFANVDIAGGVNYFLYNKDYTGNVSFYECQNDNITCESRPLFEDGLDIILAMNKFVDVIDKVRKAEDFISLMTITQGRNAFGIVGKDSEMTKISSDKKFDGSYELRCAKEVIRYISKEHITKNIEIANKWKIFTSKGNGGAGILNDEKAVAIIGKAYIGKPGSVCTDSLIPIGCFDTKEEAENLRKYMATKFLRFMVGMLKSSQNIYQNVYRFVPLLDFSNKSEINWNTSVSDIDKQLYSKYKLTNDEQKMIETMIKPML